MSAATGRFSPRVDGAALGVALLLAAAAWIFGVSPLLGSQTEAESNAATVRALRDQVERRTAEAAGARTALEQARQTAAESGFTLDAPGRLNHRIAMLTPIAEQAGLRLVGVKSEQAKRAGAYGATRITIEGLGDAPSFNTFLHLLHERCADMVIEKFELASDSVSSEYGARATMTIVWCTQPPAFADAARTEGGPRP